MQQGDGAATQGKKQRKDPSKDAIFPEATMQNAAIPFPAPVDTLPPITPEGSAVSKLSPTMFELFSQVGGVIMQKGSDITTTTVQLNMPDTIFQDAQIVLSQFATAPGEFNLALKGSPEAVVAFTNNLTSLEKAFAEGYTNFTVRIQTPELVRRSKKPLIRRKGAAGGKREDKQ